MNCVASNWFVRKCYMQLVNEMEGEGKDGGRGCRLSAESSAVHACTSHIVCDRCGYADELTLLD